VKLDIGAIGSGRPLDAYRDDARNLTVDAFSARHGEAFLLLASIPNPAPDNISSTHLAFLDEPEAATGTLTTLVYPLRSEVHIVTVGRARDNDVVVPDRSVSRRHALVKRDPRGALLISDAGSSNGTSVNGKPVLTKGAGPATPLTPGSTLRLGSLEFTFVHAAGLRGFAEKVR
jgi:FHA domain